MMKFLVHEDGYALVLTLIFMPIFLGFSLLAIDLSRGNNAHTDLQAAADALALTAARELDGRDDSIDRAKAAMTEVTNWVSFLGRHQDTANLPLVYANAAGNEFTVIFLTDIPESDSQPIDQDWVDNNSPSVVGGSVVQSEASYVYVAAQSQDLETIFPQPGEAFGVFGYETVPVRTTAVATYRAGACDVTPIFICNPFEDLSLTTSENTAKFSSLFASGKMYGRQLLMKLSPQSSPGPGNFGFLRTFGSGGNVLRNALATGAPNVCFEQDGIDTEPGETFGPVEQGLGTRFGLYSGNLDDADPDYRPARNIRKGADEPDNCSTNRYSEAEVYEALAFPNGKAPPGETDGQLPLPGGSISRNSDWNLELYLDANYGGYDLDTNVHPLNPSHPDYGELSQITIDNPLDNYEPPDTATIGGQSIQNIIDDIAENHSTYPASLPNNPETIVMPDGETLQFPDGFKPSRYDVYRYELANNYYLDSAPNEETGDGAICTPLNLDAYENELDRRTIFAAVVNCLAYADELNGAATGIPTVAFASMFLTKPLIQNGSDKFISMEMIDVTGSGGRGTLSEFLREEAYLVR